VIDKEIKANRGTELPGTPNPEVVPALFRKQAQKWEQLACEHFSSIQKEVQKSTDLLLKAVCPNDALAKKILDSLDETKGKAAGKAKTRLSDLVADVMTKPLQTSDPLFEENIKEAQLIRFEAALERYRRKTCQFGLITINDTAALFEELHISNSQNLREGIHDTLKAYYDVALTSFVHNVTSIVVERYVSDPVGPVYAFSPEWVMSLSDDELQGIAGENWVIKQERIRLQEILKGLQEATKIMAKYD
jgi:hypothetical protein